MKVFAKAWNAASLGQLTRQALTLSAPGYSLSLQGFFVCTAIVTTCSYLTYLFMIYHFLLAPSQEEP